LDCRNSDSKSQDRDTAQVARGTDVKTVGPYADFQGKDHERDYDHGIQNEMLCHPLARAEDEEANQDNAPWKAYR
jgi:hypothetical protein